MPHLRPDPRPKTLGACGPSGFWPRVWPQMRLRVCLRKILWGALNLLPREQIENSRNFPREQFHHTAPSSFQQIVPDSMASAWELQGVPRHWTPGDLAKGRGSNKNLCSNMSFFQKPLTPPPHFWNFRGTFFSGSYCKFLTLKTS